MLPDHSLIDRLRRTNAERDLLRPGDRVLVAVSGGPDSLALLHALHALRDEWAIEPVAAHMNHRMRGPTGEADAAFVRETAARWSLPVEVGARDVLALARRTGLSLEEAGREARYRFFGRAARRAGCRLVATAHTADDRVETVLLHLFRGTGLDGLAGFPARRPLRPDRPSPTVIRPLIDVTRAEVLDYCAAHGLEPRLDVTNESPDFLRNRLRRELLPLLEAQYSPALRRHLLRLARLAEEETALLDAQARELLSSALAGRTQNTRETRSHGGARRGDGATVGRGDPAKATTGFDFLAPSPRLPLRLSRVVLTAAPAALARRALRLALMECQDGPAPELATVERLLSLVRGERPGFPLPGGRLVARVTPAELVLEAVESVPPLEEWEPVSLAVPGVTPLPWTRGAITASLEPPASAGTSEPPGSPLSLLPIPPHEALLDRAKLVGPLTARPPQPGDRVQPLGMAGRRKLQDLFTDRKVPRAARRRVPVVCDEEKIVWVEGYCVSEAVKVTGVTKAMVRLVWEGDV